MAVIYLLLILGGVTTLYPFFMMVSTGMKGPTDQNDNRIVPEYWGTLGLDNKDWSKPLGTLYGKYLDDKYAGDATMVQSTRIGGYDPKFETFLQELPVNLWHAGFRQAPNQVTSRLTLRYQEWLKGRFPTIQELNRTYLEENAGFNFVTPPSELLDRKGWSPPKGRKWIDWLEFKKTLSAEFRVPIRVTRSWQEFMRGESQGQFSRVPTALAGTATRFEELTLPTSGPEFGKFVQTRVPPALLADNAEIRWSKTSTEPMPIAGFEQEFVKKNADSIKSEFTSRNFRYVANYILLNGRAVLNTLIYCALLILVQLTVNPIAAYALSRYPIKATGKILIFLLATMAFPAEVAMIPSFLLLKNLNLLNTFWALVLPAAASGYMIYLLKGFFDSLPQELYESGQLDGAKEVTMLWKIALPLSRPVLGYLALLAFMGAYGAFLFAFLIVQDRQMWTLMVSIYQLQIVAPKSVVMAALTLAAVPTLLVFLFAQRVIMRGIVLPGER